MSEQEMIERYIYEVTRRVPQEMRTEIRMELESLIEDMRTGEGLCVQEALARLGDPADFARRYRGDDSYLIGPDYYDNYIWILKIVLIGIGISAVVSALINAIMGGDGQSVSGLAKDGGGTGEWVELFTHFFTELISSAVGGALGAVGVITVIFAILERQKVRITVKPEKSWDVGELTRNAPAARAWTPFSLPAIPDRRAVIKRSDSVASIIFISIFSALLLFVPELFGAFHYEDGTLRSIACVFNLERWESLAPILVFCLGAGLVNEIVRLATGYYSRAVMYSTIICNGIQIAGAVLLLFIFPLWNPDFARKISELAQIGSYSQWDMLSYWNTEMLNRLLFLFILICSLAEVAVAVYKTLRYGRNVNKSE